MSLVFACLAPHGGGVLPEPAGESGPGWARMREAMREAGRRLRRRRPDAVVVLTPHGDGAPSALTIPVAAALGGSLHGRAPATLTVDRDVAGRVLSRARSRGLALVAPSGGPEAVLDWGVLVPLALLGPWPAGVVVRVGPEVPAGGLLAFGRVLAGVAAAGGRRVAVVASGDLAHAHDARGPYGADPAARAFDRRVLRAVAGEGPDGLLHLDPSLVARAKPDAVPQLLVLAGLLREAALSGRPLRPEVLAYEVPTYFGMLCAVYE